MKRSIAYFFILLIGIAFAVKSIEVKAFELGDGVLIMDVEDFKTEYDKIDDFSRNCRDFAKVLRIGGFIILIAKILIPLIIIVKASMNFVSVVIDGKPETLKKNFQKMLWSLIAGIFIFFIPTFINVVFGLVSKYNDNVNLDSKVCNACVFDPFGELCELYAER